MEEDLFPECVLKETAGVLSVQALAPAADDSGR